MIAVVIIFVVVIKETVPGSQNVWVLILIFFFLTPNQVLALHSEDGKLRPERWHSDGIAGHVAVVSWLWGTGSYWLCPGKQRVGPSAEDPRARLQRAHWPLKGAPGIITEVELGEGVIQSKLSPLADPALSWSQLHRWPPQIGMSPTLWSVRIFFPYYFPYPEL